MIKSWRKDRTTKKKHFMSASFSTELFSILTMISIVLLCISGLFVAFGMGALQRLLTTASILIGVFFNSCILNIALYWYILGTFSLVKTRINVSMKGFGFLGAIACFYLAAVCGIYFFTDNVLLTLAIPLAADIVLAVSMSIGYFKLSRKLAKQKKIMAPASSRSTGGMRRLLVGRSTGEEGMRLSQRSSFTSGRLHHHHDDGKSVRRFSCVQLTGRSSPPKTGRRRRGILLDRTHSPTITTSNSFRNPPCPDGGKKSLTILVKRIVSRLYLSFFCTVGIALAATDPTYTTREAIMCCLFVFLDLWSVLSCCQIIFCCMDEKNIYKRTLAKHLSKNAVEHLLNVTKAKFCSRRNQTHSQVCVAAAEDALPEQFLNLSSSSSLVFEGSSSPPAEGAKLHGQPGRRVAPFIAEEVAEEGQRERATQEVAPSANPPHQVTDRPLLAPGATGFALGHSALIYDVVYGFILG